MALWGNNDAVGSGGTVSLNYDTRVVTGTGTTFGQVGAAKTGDVIRFGARGGNGTYFGDATIVAIAGTQSLTIGSTLGLSGVAIAGTDFHVSELPTFTTLDATFSNSSFANHEAAAFVNTVTGTATTNAGIGASVAPVFVGFGNLITEDIRVGDTIINNSVNVPIVSIGTATARAADQAGVGTNIIPVTKIPGLIAADKFIQGSTLHTITAVTATQVTIGTTIATGIATGDKLLFSGGNLIGLGASLTAGIGTDDTIQFQRLIAGYDKVCYGISTVTSGGLVVGGGSADQYHVAHQGWVGVTTYMDNHGNLRVKSEVLCAMSGINTAPDGLGTGIQYPTPQE